MTSGSPLVMVLIVSARDREHMGDLLDRIGASTPDDGPEIGQIVEHSMSDGFAFQSLREGCVSDLGEVIDHLRELRRPL